MIRKNLFRGIPFCLALGLMITPVISAHTEAYGTGLTKSAIKDEIDPGFMIKPEIFVNNKELNSDDVKILNSEAYLPLEKVAFSMGDRLEGSYEDAYMLRKSDKMINMDIKNNKYRVNGIESNVKFEVVDNIVYVPIRFLSDVLGYNMGYEGNCIYIGEGSEQYNENANGEVNVDLSGDHLIDDAMMLNPEIYINSDKYPDFGVKVYDGKVYLPLETVTLKMGDRLEGDISTEYYLRKNNMMLVINFAENTYILNGKKHESKMITLGGQVYASLDFYKDVLNYSIKEDGNSFYIGEIKDKEVLPNTVSGGKWVFENGNWYYSNGESRVTGWVRDNNNWYYLKADGSMATGWVKDSGKWYLLNNNGAMETGWVVDNNNAYYLNKDGSMASGTTVDGFMLADSGVAISLY